MTSRRLVLAAADRLATAISLAFWLSSRAKNDAWTHRIQRFVQIALGAAADSTPALRTRCFDGGAGRSGRPGFTSGTTALPIARETSSRAWTSLTEGVSRSVSSEWERIPLLVAPVKALQTVLRRTAIRPWNGTVDGKSLKRNLSLEWSAA